MRKMVFVLSLVLFAMPASVRAQEEAEETGQLVQLVTWKVQPEHADAWVETVEALVAAAQQANLSADYGWGFWSQPFRYTLVYLIDSFGYFDSPDQWRRQFEGTPGEEALNAAFARFPSIMARVEAEELLENKPSWSYKPAGDGVDVEVAHVDQFWVRPGQEEAFGEAVEAYVQLAADINFPYEIMAFQVRFGDSDRVDFVTLGDSKSAMYGENDFGTLAQAAGQGERLGELFEQLKPTVDDWKHFDTDREASMTYWGPATDE